MKEIVLQIGTCTVNVISNYTECLTD